MIYCLINEGIIKIVKNAKETENNYLLYSVSAPFERVKNDLRFWKRLDLSGDCYKDDPGLHDYFINHGWNDKYSEQQKVETYERDAIIDDFLSVCESLSISLPPQPFPREKIIYECDIYNFLYSWVGVETCNLIFDFYELGKRQQDFILEIQKISGKEKLNDRLEEGLIEFGEDHKIYQFFPEWFRFNHKILGDTGLKNNRNLRPEYRNKGRLDRWKNFDEDAIRIISKEVFKRFEVGRIYTGKYIKTEMQRIYDLLEIEKMAKIKDIFEYFDISKFNLRESEYRIVTRKTL